MENSLKEIRLAIGSQIYLPHTQSWIYRQMKAKDVQVKLVVCNELANMNDFFFEPIVVVPPRSLFWRKVAYKLHFVLKHVPFFISAEKWKAYYAALRAHRINLMHVHFGVMGVELMSVCEYAKIPLVVTFHGFDITAVVKRDPSYHKALLQLFSKIKTAIAISDEMKTRLVKLGCPSEKIKVSYLGIPIEQFPEVDRSSHSSTVRFLHAGRFSETKGVPALIDAFSAEFDRQDDVLLTIIGQGEEMDNVVKAIERSRVKNKIRLLGQQKSSDMHRILSECDVFVLNCRTPSSGDKEGLPISILEASSTGLPVISTYHSGVPEAVIHERTGLLVEEYDQQGLSMSMRRLMDKSIRLDYGRNARLLMEERFDLTQCNEVLSRIYQEAVF